MDPFDVLRKRIDDIDAALVALLSERATCALEIGRLKEAHGLPIYQPTREVQVIAHVREANRGPLDDDAIARLFERIIDEARRLERLAPRQGSSGGHSTER
jgi:chorismate mutase